MMNVKKQLVSLKSEIRNNILIYLLLLVILTVGFTIRVWRVDQILGFYFDQGRDAKVIWDFLHKGKFFLVGPTTGIAGIFRGPFYYYLIAPFYLIGGGNPVWPSVFLAFTTVVAIVFVYYLGVKLVSRWAGLAGAVIASFSFNLLLASRWLSNPTPMLLLSMLLLWMLYLVVDGKRWAWVFISLIAGSSLFHFGSAGEVFYFPALVLIFVWMLGRNKWSFEKTIGVKYFVLAVGAFLFTAAPLVLFDLRHGGILSTNIQGFLFNEESFKGGFGEVLVARLAFYYDVFSNKIFHWRRSREIALLSVVAGYFIIFLPRLWRNDYFKVTMIMFFAPILGLLFFQGNFGNIYDYYLTGYYLIFVLLFASVLGVLWKSKIGKVFVIYFLFVFLLWDGRVIRYRISAGVDGKDTIAFGNQKQAVDWIYGDAEGQPFSLDVYVPPVIPHAYDYLFEWYGSTRYGYTPVALDELIDPLYTLSESDPPHPERLEVWFERQDGIGEVEPDKTATFGGITVQRRVRLPQEDE